ncbi:MAG TPA: hypothetical protein ENI51_07975 [Candidatus Atribacteria bacterium]|nr:hypothetical protein [Candidatus Atribacteria bacterium]
MRLIKKFKIRFSKKGKRYTKFILLCLSLSFIFSILQMQNVYGVESEIYAYPINMSNSFLVKEKGINDNNFVYSFKENQTINKYPHLTITSNELSPKLQLCNQFLFDLPKITYYDKDVEQQNQTILKNDYIYVLDRKVIANDNLSNFNIGDVPNGLGDGVGYWHWGNYKNYNSLQYVKVQGNISDALGITYGKTLYCKDGSTSYPSETIYANFTKTSFGNVTFNVYFQSYGSRRWDLYLGYYDNNTKSYKRVFHGCHKQNAWYGGFSGFPAPENFAGKWVRFEICFEARENKTNGYDGLSTYQLRAHAYIYSSHARYTANIYNFQNNNSFLNYIRYCGDSGSYYHEVYFHDNKITQPYNKTVITDNIRYFNISVNREGYDELYLDYNKVTNVSDCEVYIKTNTSWIQINESEQIRIYRNYLQNNSILFKVVLDDNFLQSAQITTTLTYRYKNGIKTSFHTIKQTFYAYTKSNPTSETDGLDYRVIIELTFNNTGIEVYKIHTNKWTGTGWLSGSSLINYTDISGDVDIENLEFDTQILVLQKNSTYSELITFTRLIINQNESLSVGFYNNSISTNPDGIYFYIKEIEISGRYYTFNGKYYDNKNFDLLKARFLYVNFRDYLSYFPILSNFKYNINLQPKPPSEPEPPSEPNPVTSNYWTYQSFRIIESNKIEVVFDDYIDFYNDTQYIKVNYNFTQIKGEAYTAKFYYDKSAIKELRASNLGDWGINNWLRDLLCNLANVFITILNAILLFLQFLLFCVVVAFNYLIMFLAMMIILPFLWNIIVYWIIYALAYLWFLIYSGLVYVLGLIITFFSWLYLNVLIPFAEWFLNTALPVIVEVVALVFAFILALIIWLATLCQGDFNEIFKQTNEMTQTIADFLIDSIVLVIENLPALLQYLMIYITLTAFCYLKMLYAKAKGFSNRVAQLQESLEAYMFPFEQAYKLIVKMKELGGRWT